MKLTLFFGSLATLLLVSQSTSALIPPYIIRKCVESTQIQAVDLALFYGTDYRMVSTPIKCYMTCIFEATGLVADGKISDDLIQMAKNPAEAEKFKALAEVCSNNAEGECEPSFQAYRCWMTKGKH